MTSRSNLKSQSKFKSIEKTGNRKRAMSRRHIICKSSIIAEMNQKFHSQKNTNMCRITNEKLDDFEES
eukprot:UN05281